MISPSAIVELTAATKSFALPGGQAFQALRGIDLRITAGEHVAVLGKSGSGKSTLLNLIAGLDRASTGDVRVAGAGLGKLSENELARWRGANLGVVFQFFQLLPTLTIEENIMLAMDFVGKIPVEKRRPRTHELLKLVGLSDQALKLPSTLSGGQQQRAAIARALANDPPLLLADEPTGNLDSETSGEILDVFAALNRELGTTIVLVTHEADIASRAQRLVRLKDGIVTYDGPSVSMQNA